MISIQTLALIAIGVAALEGVAVIVLAVKVHRMRRPTTPAPPAWEPDWEPDPIPNPPTAPTPTRGPATAPTPVTHMPITLARTDTGELTVIQPTPPPPPDTGIDIDWPSGPPTTRPIKAADLIARYRKEHGDNTR